MLAVAAGAERLTQAMRSLEAAFLIGVEGVTTIWLVRHGDCYEDMAEGADPPLSATGRKQAQRLAERVHRAGPAAIYSSPYRRAVETARFIGDDVH
jgi:probable phosphoglycerate mutase